MDLRKYLSASRGRATELAMEIGASLSYLGQMASGARPVPPQFAPLIERKTGVMRWDLRPTDWHKIWPELMQRPDAPPIPTSSADLAKAGGKAPAGGATTARAGEAEQGAGVA